MARYIENLNECTDPTTGDFLLVTDASAGSTDKDRKVNISRFAILANTQTFTAQQTFTPTANTTPINISTPSNQGAAAISVGSGDCGSSYGPHISVGRNSNASTPAAGFLYMAARPGTMCAIWVDNTGVVRLNTAAVPTNANDTSGTIIGNQSSYVGLKTDVVEWNDTKAALDAVMSVPLFSYRFIADQDDREYRGIVITDEDRGAWFSDNDKDNQVPSLNERNLFGYLIAAIQEQQRQIEELKARVNQ